MPIYDPLVIQHTGPYGLYESLDAMRIPKRNSEGDSDMPLFYRGAGYIGPKDAALAKRLILAGDDHAKSMRGPDIHLKLWMQVGFMVEFETYVIGATILSTSSTMHNELRGMSGPELAEIKQAMLPELVYLRRLKVNYQTLRRMYLARRSHRHPDWQIMCNFIETLPFFDVLIIPA